MLSASIYYGTKFNNDIVIHNYPTHDLDWGFGFNIVGAVFVLAAGGAIGFQVLFQRATQARNRPT
jgi:hypothetical protein